VVEALEGIHIYVATRYQHKRKKRLWWKPWKVYIYNIHNIYIYIYSVCVYISVSVYIYCTSWKVESEYAVGLYVDEGEAKLVLLTCC
jgi:hypothetical protein